jgi:hypothetical protein
MCRHAALQGDKLAMCSAKAGNDRFSDCSYTLEPCVRGRRRAGREPATSNALHPALGSPRVKDRNRYSFCFITTNFKSAVSRFYIHACNF